MSRSERVAFSLRSIVDVRRFDCGVDVSQDAVKDANASSSVIEDIINNRRVVVLIEFKNLRNAMEVLTI